MGARLTIEEFNRATANISQLGKLNYKFDVNFESVYDGDGKEIINITPCNLHIDKEQGAITVLSKIWEIFNKPFLTSIFRGVAKLPFKPTAVRLGKMADRNKYKSFKFFPLSLAGVTAIPVKGHHNAVLPYLITETPYEVQEGENTLRLLVSDDNECVLCVSQENKYYNYLDKGFFVLPLLQHKRASSKYIITDEYTIDTCLIMLMCMLDFSLVSELVGGCFIPAAQAPLMKIKMEKALATSVKSVYAGWKTKLLVDYEKYGNQILVGKLTRGEIEEMVIENIKFTKRSCSYEGVSVEIPKLMEIIVASVDFNSQFDIYNIVQIAIDNILNEFEASAINGQTPHDVNFSINGMKLCLHIDENRRRLINGINIRIDELSKVLSRATCYRELPLYEAFLKEVDRMSLMYHDVVSNGLAIKLGAIDCRDVSDKDLSRKLPKLKFRKDKSKFMLLLNEAGEVAQINLRKIISLVRIINKQTTGGWDRRGRKYRDHEWAASELNRALMISTRMPIKNAEGVVIGYNGVTAVQAKILSNMVLKWHEEALKRSELFLEDVVKMTGAKLTEYKGEPAYQVDGSMHKYVVIKKDGKVFNAETNKYVCIVNFGNNQGIGMDQIATRLMALKNDKMMVEQITTLRAG